jgi:hypothetical protein
VRLFGVFSILLFNQTGQLKVEKLELSFQQIDRKFILMLLQSHGFLEYIEAILLDERPSLNNTIIINFLFIFLPKVSRASCCQS